MISIALIQLFAAIFALFALSRVYLRFKERKLSSFAFIFWFIVWIFGVITIIFPELTTKVARFLGIGRGVDVVIYASIVTLFYLIFRTYIKIEDTQKQITELTRKIALQKFVKTNTNSSEKKKPFRRK